MSGPDSRPGRHPADGRRAGPARRFRRCLFTAAAGALTVVAPALPAAAIGPGGSAQFGLTPAPGRDGQTAPYFMLTVVPGGSASGIAVLSNPGSTTEKLKISRSTGVTAGNGGSSFSRAFRKCSGTGCWLTITPTSVTLAAHTEEGLRLTVHVPAGARPRQYLAGISAENAVRPAPVTVGAHGQARAQAVIVDQVTVGVAVTVGSLSQMTTRLRIRGVSGADEGRTARLNIRLDNTGQTFAHGTARASCTAAGRRHSFAVVVPTVLPGGHAVIAVNAPGLPEGTTVRCRVRLHYGAGLTAGWAGRVAIPAPPRVRIVHTGRGAYSVVPAGDRLTPWLIALLAVGVLILAALAVLIRQRRRLPGRLAEGQGKRR
jgi:hypothetical protein